MPTPEKHAKCSASASHRWINCTAAPTYEAQFPDGETSVYAREGTLAHKFAELAAQYNFSQITKRTRTTRLKKLQAEELYDEEMLKTSEFYADLKLLNIDNDGRVLSTIRNIRIIIETDKNVGLPFLSRVKDCTPSTDIEIEDLEVTFDALPIWRTYRHDLDRDDYFADGESDIHWNTFDRYGMYEYLEATYGITDLKKIDMAFMLAVAEDDSAEGLEDDDICIRPLLKPYEKEEGSDG